MSKPSVKSLSACCIRTTNVEVGHRTQHAVGRREDLGWPSYTRQLTVSQTDPPAATVAPADGCHPPDWRRKMALKSQKIKTNVRRSVQSDSPHVDSKTHVNSILSNAFFVC